MNETTDGPLIIQPPEGKSWWRSKKFAVVIAAIAAFTYAVSMEYMDGQQFSFSVISVVVAYITGNVWQKNITG